MLHISIYWFIDIALFGTNFIAIWLFVFICDYLYREGKKVSIHFYDAPSIENKPKKTLGPNDGTDNNKEIR